MANPSLDLRGGASGPSFEPSTPGHVLTVDANGKTVSPQPAPVAPGGLVSFNGRTTPAAMPEAGDYEAEQIPYVGNAPGADVEAALDGLQDELDDQQTDIDAAAAAAAAAQGTATAAGVAAAAAQGTADAASAAASAAQGTATAAGAAAAAAQGTANTAVTAAGVADAKAVAAQQPFRGAYYVSPVFAGTQLGSASNPFTSITAALAFAVGAGVASGTIYLAPGSNTVENVTLPLTGEWDIVGLTSPGNLTSCIITGNVAIGASASARRWLRDVSITGNVTGNTSAGTHRITFERVNVTGTTTLTVTGAGVVRLGSLGGVPSPFLSNGNMAWTFLTGAVVVQGTVWGGTTQFGSTLSVSGRCTFWNCTFNGNISTTAESNDDNDLIFNDCIPLAAISINISQTVGGRLALVNATNSSFDSVTVNFSGIGINVFALDASTARSMFGHGATLTGAAVPTTMQSVRLTGQVNNIGVTIFGFKNPVPQLRVNGTLTLVTPGTAGAAVLNITYTDSIGVARTKAVTTALNIAGVAGDEAQGSLLFTQNGSASFQYSVTGIVTPGALSYNLAIGLEAGL